MLKKTLVTLVILAALGAAAWYGWQQYRGMSAGPPPGAARPPPTVSAAEVQTATWTPTLASVGSLRAVQGVSVTTEVPGIVERIAFESGKRVKRGELLVQLDDKADRAQLEELKAALALAGATLKRERQLERENFASEARLDEAQSRYRQVEAQVQRQRVLIDKKAIRAPFSGRLGIRQVDLGQFVDSGAPVVTLQALDPIYVDFSLPQQELQQVREGRSVRFTVDAYPDAGFEGKVTAITPLVNRRTRNFEVQATLDNAAGRLRPGMFGQVEVLLPEKRDVLTLPQTAISYNPYGNYVFRLSEGQADGKMQLVANRVFVKTGDQRGTLIEIVSGVKAGERVVTSGQLKLRDGQAVRVDNEVAPVATATPRIEGP